MGIIAFGINHKTAPVAVREKVSFDPATMPDVLQQVLETLVPVTEVSILSTCNRTEIYCSYKDEGEDADKQAGQALLSWLSCHHD